jgi:hypothetical protein
MHCSGKSFVRQCGIKIEEGGIDRLILSHRSDRSIDVSYPGWYYLIVSKHVLTSARALFVLMIQVKCFDEVQLERE